MSYVGRMRYRMLLPALVPLAVIGVVTWLLPALRETPRQFSWQLIFPDLLFQIVMVSAAACVIVSGWQFIRLWRWTRGKGAVCYVCGCLLARERDGRSGPHRKCLGCGKSHPFSKGRV